MSEDEGGSPPALASAAEAVPAPASTPARRKTSSLGVFLAVVGAIFVLVLIGLGVGAYLLWSNPQARTMVGVARESVKIIHKAQTAPGTKELRGLGCGQALVLDLEDVARLMAYLDAGAPPDTVFSKMLLCQPQILSTAPSCDAVVETYVQAVGAGDRPLMVRVARPGENRSLCHVLYDGAGRRVEDLGEDGFVPPVE